MKREENNIDQYFRDGLRDYESPLATNLWDKLDATREEDKKPKGIVWWKWGLGASLLTLLIASTFYFLNSKQEKTNLPSTKVETESPITSIPTTKTSEQASNAVEEAKQVATNKNTTSLTEIADTKIEQSKPLKAQEISNTSKKSTATKNSVNESSAMTSTANSTRNKPVITTPKILTETKNFQENKNITDLQTRTSSQPLETKSIKAQPIASVTEEAAVEKNKATRRLDFLKTTAATLLDDPSSIALAFDTPPIKMPFSWGPKGCYSFAGGRIKYDYYVDAFISPEYAIRKLSARTAEDENYRQRRDETEATLYGLSGGLRLSVVTRRGLALRTGIVYNRILERFSLEKEGDTRIVQVVQAGTMDTITTIETGTTIVRTYNRYHSIDIPLLLGYEVDAGNFNFNINAGAYFNIYARQKGKILSQSDEPEFITSNNPQRINAFEKDLGISLYGSIGLNYQIRPGLQLLIEPNLRYQLKPISLATYPLEQQYINVGLLLGVRRQF